MVERFPGKKADEVSNPPSAPKFLVAFTIKSLYNIGMKNQWVVLGCDAYTSLPQWWWGPFESKEDAEYERDKQARGVVVEIVVDYKVQEYFSTRLENS